MLYICNAVQLTMKNINRHSDTLPFDHSGQTGQPLCSFGVLFMKELKLNQSKGKNNGKYVALIDDEDYERLNKHKWYIHTPYKRNNCDLIYCIRSEKKMSEPGIDKTTTIMLHREILNIDDKNIFIDHIDRNGLNCQKNNLRISTRSQNQGNRKSNYNSTSNYKGVSYSTNYKKYISVITENKKRYHLGRFENEIDAAKAYDRKAIELFGEFAKPNFPDFDYENYEIIRTMHKKRIF